MERNVSVRTPESVSFYYELAGLGSRFLAVSVDFVIQVTVGLAIFLIAAWTESAIFGSKWSVVVLAIVVLAAFVLFTGYFVAFEVWWNGQTPGKRLIGIRVVRDGGYPITFMDSVIRNLVRAIEAPLMYVPSIASALLSPENKRLGDLAAGTIVVRHRDFEVADSSRWARNDEQADAAAAAIPGTDQLTDEEIALARRYVDRSTMLSPLAARETAAKIASAIRPRLGAAAARYDDHELLVRIALRDGRR
ncbi:MAG TPA: RDD family protein [Candidatus Eremiobacteraceae bacterium]|nr:RDD family protein [Candidatus Eremiobacteraceae bacterium]